MKRRKPKQNLVIKKKNTILDFVIHDIATMTKLQYGIKDDKKSD
tara:strand:+ start:1378 stop:1509 length:132 start_codon:yes stop_codon:yes gene_type:complete